MIDLPDAFIRHTLQRGEEGQPWLEALPGLVEELASRWKLRIGKPFDLSYNVVLVASQADGTPAVLKIAFPTDTGYEGEVDALRLYDGQGAVRLLEVDEAHKAMLLERVQPGIPLSQMEDDVEATTILAAAMQRLWKDVPEVHRFPAIAEWFVALDEYGEHFRQHGGPIPIQVVEEASYLFQALDATTERRVVCHGDFHHFNVLQSEQGWTVIDPKGVIADPAYDAVVLLQNPDVVITKKLLNRRIDQLTDLLGMDRQRIVEWGYAHTVLSAVWCWEDGDQCTQSALAVADLFDR